MSTVDELIAKYNAEPVCGRLIARVGGRNEYIADYGPTGFMLTEVGLKLEEGILQADARPASTDEFAAPVEAPKAKTRAKKAAAAEDTPVKTDSDDLSGRLDEALGQ